MFGQFEKKPGVVDSPKATALKENAVGISFRQVFFSYGARSALKNVSFEVKPGTSTAIVGESGSGKSTCLKLLYRFYNVSDGSICINDQDVRSFTIDSIREQIGVVPQDTALFNATLMYNLQYGKPDITEEDVYEACKTAKIHHQIMNWPDGYKTMVGERGLRLSGGEKQRVSKKSQSRFVANIVSFAGSDCSCDLKATPYYTLR